MSSRALFFALKAKGKPATFLCLTFKSKYARSYAIELRPASVQFTATGPNQPPLSMASALEQFTSRVRVLPTFFRLGAASGMIKGIKVEKPPPEIASSPLSASVRLQLLRERERAITT